MTTLTQVTAYKGILERKQNKPRNTTKKNLQLTQTAIKRITREIETNAVIWKNTWKKTIRPLVQQFIYKTLHGTHLVRKYWSNINGYEEWKTCRTCNETKSMNHILTQCKERNTQTIW